MSLINTCVYSHSYSKVISKIMNETSSGSFCLNDCVLQSVMVGMPFGGVGEALFLCDYSMYRNQAAQTLFANEFNHQNRESSKHSGFLWQVPVEWAPIMVSTVLMHSLIRSPAFCEPPGLSAWHSCVIHLMRTATCPWSAWPALWIWRVRVGALFCKNHCCSEDTNQMPFYPHCGKVSLNI